MAKPKKKSAVVRILVAHGVNLDLLGQREPKIYGTSSIAMINAQMRQHVTSLAAIFTTATVELEFFQSNSECAYLEKLDGPWDAIILNPGAWTHTSLALADRLAGLGVPYVEVHLSNTAAREEIRQTSLTSIRASGVVQGFGENSYLAGLLGILGTLFPRK